ncbi:sulfotransferase 6B1 isoform X2 [Xenopus laevis]|uniref:Sulfotransferase n=1 Tax=Xenopus laevis TaxID=8355 RepID=A0A8J1KST5_XENLA|nr:sulfotransferase 6B1 isoform X2 [Xenopus laevis]
MRLYTDLFLNITEENGACELRCPEYAPRGTNWTLHLLQDIVYAVHKKDPAAVIPMLEFCGENKFEKLKEEASPRVLGTHLSYDGIPKSFFNKPLKMLVVFRNPKDTALSYYHFYNNNPTLPKYSCWDTFFEDFMAGNVCWGSYFDHVLAWNKHIDNENIMIVTFEELKKDLEVAVRNISKFFGFSLTEEQIRSIADKGTFKSMKEKSEETHGAMGKSIFRKGEVGDWRNIFTEAQNQEMDAKFEACLAGTKLGEMLQYNVYCK